MQPFYDEVSCGKNLLVEHIFDNLQFFPNTQTTQQVIVILCERGLQGAPKSVT